MTPQEFTKKYYPFALESQKKTGIHALAVIAQAAQETGWGKTIVGNMMFGVKAKANTPANKKQLLTTTEYHSTNTVKYPVIISIEKQSNGKYKYKVKDYFMKYDSPKESFDDHSDFFFRNQRYAKALAVKNDANKFIDEIAKAGYATDPNYATSLKSIIKRIQQYV